MLLICCKIKQQQQQQQKKNKKKQKKIIGKIQDGGQEGDHCWGLHRPPAAPPPIKYTSSC